MGSNQLRTALVPLSTGQHHQHQLENIWVWHTRTASITSISCELLWPRNQQVSMETRGPGTHERPASPASAANCFGPDRQVSIISISCELLRPAINRSALRASVWKSLGLAQTTSAANSRSTGQHHQHQLRIAAPCNQQISITSISLEIIGSGTDEPPASRASAANCFGAAINRPAASRASA